MKHRNIAFIGAGNMAGALISGLIASGYPADKLYVSNPSAEKLELLKQRFAIHITQNNAVIAANAEVIVLAVKPAKVRAVCEELKHLIADKKPLLISVATGVASKTITDWIGVESAVVRAMPNTPIAVGAGATGLFANAATNEDDKSFAEMLFRSAGLAIWLNSETEIDWVTAVSGSGPAYYFLFMEAMEEAAQKMGMSEEVAQLLISQTILGAARMAMESAEGVRGLRQSVTSPQGTTEAAINVFEAKQLRQIVAEAMEAAYQRAKELSWTH